MPCNAPPGGDWLKWWRTKTATGAFRSQDEIRVSYHDCEVFKLDCRRNIVTLRDCGWLTDNALLHLSIGATTARRINNAARLLGLDVGVSRTNWVWYAHGGGETVEFFDGVQLRAAPRVYEAFSGVRIAYLYSSGFFTVTVDDASCETFDTWLESFDYARSVGRPSGWEAAE